MIQWFKQHEVQLQTRAVKGQPSGGIPLLSRKCMTLLAILLIIFVNMFLSQTILPDTSGTVFNYEEGKSIPGPSNSWWHEYVSALPSNSRMCTRREILDGDWKRLMLDSAPYKPPRERSPVFLINASYPTWDWQPLNNSSCVFLHWQKDLFCAMFSHHNATLALMGDSLTFEHRSLLIMLLGMPHNPKEEFQSFLDKKEKNFIFGTLIIRTSSFLMPWLPLVWIIKSLRHTNPTLCDQINTEYPRKAGIVCTAVIRVKWTCTTS
jgi:hypothetical protein